MAQEGDPASKTTGAAGTGAGKPHVYASVWPIPFCFLRSSRKSEGLWSHGAPKIFGLKACLVKFGRGNEHTFRLMSGQHPGSAPSNSAGK